MGRGADASASTVYARAHARYDLCSAISTNASTRRMDPSARGGAESRHCKQQTPSRVEDHVWIPDRGVCPRAPIGLPAGALRTRR